MNDPRGSLWRKWDLHVHTPYSIVQGYGGEGAEDAAPSYFGGSLFTQAQRMGNPNAPPQYSEAEKAAIGEAIFGGGGGKGGGGGLMGGNK